MRNTVRFIIFISLVFALACRDQRPSENAPILSVAAPVVADSPFVIGVSDGDPNYDFAEIAGITQRRDGTIVGADRGSSSIRFFDKKGKFIRRVGRNGGGPGEYGILGYFIPLEEGYIVTDWRAQRLTLLNEKGKYLRIVS